MKINYIPSIILAILFTVIVIKYQNDKITSKKYIANLNLIVGHSYVVNKINIIDGHTFSVLTNNNLYLVKLNNTITDDTAKEKVAEIIGLSDKVDLLIRAISIHDKTIYADLYLHQNNLKLNLSQWLKDKNLVYKN